MTGFAQRIAFAAACGIVARVAGANRVAVERVTLARAHGRVLDGDVAATLDQPPFDNAAMDGFALRHSDLVADSFDEGKPGTRLVLAGEQFAGARQPLRVDAGSCVRITTGAPLPHGTDTVVMKENAREEGGAVTVTAWPASGRHVRRRGEDACIGDTLLRSGDVLTPSRIALLAAQGHADVAVSRRPTVAVFTTGDELVEPGLPLADGLIYNSNREQLTGLLRADGFEPVAWPTLPDDPGQVASALRHAGHAFDVVLTCGAVSAGEKDHVPALLQREGRMHFWRVRLRPGMPVLLADGGGEAGLGDAVFLCLPGNPVSVLATYLTLGRLLLDGMQGRSSPRPRLRARLAAPWIKTHDRVEFLRGRLDSRDDGSLWAWPNPADGSHRMRAAADSDALLVLPEDARDLVLGDVVDVLPY